MDMLVMHLHVLHYVACAGAVQCEMDVLVPHLPDNVERTLQSEHVHAACAHLRRSFVCHIMLCMVPLKWRITGISRLARLASLGSLGGLHGRLDMLVLHYVACAGAVQCEMNVLVPHLPDNVEMTLQSEHVHAACAHLRRSFVCHIMLCMVPLKWRITGVSRLARLASLGSLGGLHGRLSHHALHGAFGKKQ